MHAWILDLPGCVVGGRDTGELKEMLPLALAEHTAWLRRNGESVEPDGDWNIVEQVDGLALADHGGEFLFDCEREPLRRAELERLLARADWARAELLDSVRDLPDAILDWSPPKSAFTHFDSWAPEVRTIRDLVRHALQLEVYYRGGLHDGPTTGVFEAVSVFSRGGACPHSRCLAGPRRCRA
jgi:hypothetical protein